MVEGLITQPRNIHRAIANAVCPDAFHVFDAVYEAAKFMNERQLENQILGLVHTNRTIGGWFPGIDNIFR